MYNLPVLVFKMLKNHSIPLWKKPKLLTNDTPNIVFRILGADDANAYKNIRTKAITGKDRRYFTADPEKELKRSLDDWRHICAKTLDQIIIGAFEKEELVGIWSVMLSEKDTTGKTVYYSAVYVLPEYRHTGITKKMIQMWKTWAMAHGCDKALFTIRTDNPWLEKHIKNGALIKKKYDAQFADGSTAPIYLIEQPLYTTYEPQVKKLESELLKLLELDSDEKKMTGHAHHSSLLSTPPARHAGNA